MSNYQFHSNRSIKISILIAASVISIAMVFNNSPGYAFLTFIIGLMVM